MLKRSFKIVRSLEVEAEVFGNLVGNLIWLFRWLVPFGSLNPINFVFLIGFHSQFMSFKEKYSYRVLLGFTRHDLG